MEFVYLTVRSVRVQETPRKMFLPVLFRTRGRRNLGRVSE